MSAIKGELIRTVRQLPMILALVWYFVAALAPLMFLVGVISSIDQVSQHRRLLENLQAYGVVIQGSISYVDLDNRRAGVDFVRSDGSVGYGSLDLRYYPYSVSQSLERDQVLQIYYIDALVSGWDEVILAEYYHHVRAYAPISREAWGILGGAFLMILSTPQFLFLGMADFEKLFPKLSLLGKSAESH